MHTCPLLNSFSAARGKTAASRDRRDSLASHVVRCAAQCLAGLTGAGALLNLLRTIPRSNDDFSLF